MGESKMNQLSSDIEVIKNKIENLDKNFTEFKRDTLGMVDKINKVENQTVVTSERVSNLSIFQGAFSIVIGAIATYLGIQNK